MQLMINIRLTESAGLSWDHLFNGSTFCTDEFCVIELIHEKCKDAKYPTQQHPNYTPHNCHPPNTLIDYCSCSCSTVGALNALVSLVVDFEDYRILAILWRRGRLVVVGRGRIIFLFFAVHQNSLYILSNIQLSLKPLEKQCYLFLLTINKFTHQLIQCCLKLIWLEVFKTSIEHFQTERKKKRVLIVYRYVSLRIRGGNQQQLAGIFDLTVWHFTQISSVSLQLSTQKGQHQNIPPVKKRRQRHQRIVTQPIFFLGIWPVSLPQAMQGDPSPLLLFPPIVMMVGPCCCGGGGAYMGWAIIGWAIMGWAIIGCPYIFYIMNINFIRLNLRINIQEEQNKFYKNLYIISNILNNNIFFFTIILRKKLLFTINNIPLEVPKIDNQLTRLLLGINLVSISSKFKFQRLFSKIVFISMPETLSSHKIMIINSNWPQSLT